MKIILLKAQPSPAQIKAGNYPKRKVQWRGLTISVENEKGSVRRGTDPSGKPWETKMLWPYGYIKSSVGVDGDQVDCYLGPDEDSDTVYVVHQRKAGQWDKFDEDKAMLQFGSERAAIAAFRAHYNDKRFLGPITAMPADEFVEKVRATKDEPKMIKGGLPGAPGLHPQKVIDKRGRSVTHWVANHPARAYNDEKQLSFDFDSIYKHVETRPDTTTEQKRTGGAAFLSLQRRVNMVRDSGGQTATLLGSRLCADFVAVGGSQLTGQRIASPGDLAALAQVYRDPRFETFRAIYIKDGVAVGEAAYSSRLPGAIRMPDDYVQQISADVVRFGADGYYMLHNHPAGYSNASQADIRLTSEAVRTGPKMLGHVIVDHNEYSVIDDTSTTWTVRDDTLSGTDFHNSPSLDHPLLGAKIGSPKDVALIAKAMQADGVLEKSPVMIMTKGQYSEVDLIASVPLSILPGHGEKTARAQAWIRGIGRATGAGGYQLLCVSNKDFDSMRGQLTWLIRKGLFYDVVSSDGRSLALDGVMKDRFDKETFEIRGAGHRVAESLADDLEAQEKWLTDEAAKLGFSSIDELAIGNYPAFERLAEQWRDDHAVVDALYQPGMEWERAGRLSSQSGRNANPAPIPAHLNNYTLDFLRQDFSDDEIAKSIILIFPNGNEHTLGPDQYAFDDEMRKAQQLEAGQHWITVHPNGKDAKGVPVLVQESHNGSGVFHVIGGAGGKLNYLKLRGLKPQSSYKEQAAERSKAKREQKKVLRARDKELGIDAAKNKAREDVAAQDKQRDIDFIGKVAEKMGWTEEDLQPKIPDNLSDVARRKVEAQHHSALLRKANEAVEMQHQKLLMDAQTREEAGGVAPIADEHTPDDRLTVDDLDDARPTAKASLGFAAHYAERAEAQGATAEDISQEAGSKKAARQADFTDAQKQAVKTRGDKAAQIKAEIESIREPVTSNVKAVLAEAKDAVELLKARKEWKEGKKAAQKARKQIDEATEVKAYNLEVSASDESDVQAEIENDLRTLRTTAFLSAVKAETDSPERDLRQHLGAGAFNSINGLALAAGGAALVDRSVVDVLGMEGAARVLARRLYADLPDERMEEIVSGMENYHLDRYMQASKDAMQEAQELHDAAKEIALGMASHGDDFEAAREMNRRRRDCVEQAHKILGTTLGEMEANAALVTALKEGRSDRALEVPMGNVSDEDAIRQARAIGLQRGDYSIDRVAGGQVLTVTPEGMDRLAKPIDREDLERTRNTMDILSGGQDEDDWLPQGFARRPDLALDIKPGVAPTLAKRFEPSGDLSQALRDYIGGRTADGDSPADIVADIQSADFFAKAGDADAYRAALDDVAPLKGADGKMARVETLADLFDKYADSFVAHEYGGKLSTLQRQQFEPDATAQDALHRALSDEPAGIVAYKPIGELAKDDQRALREYFYSNVAHESPDAADLRGRLERIEATEPTKEVEDMFGEMSVNPEWNDWKSQRDTLAAEVGAASLDWQKYAGAMHGHENAYAAIQDLIKSKVAKSFNEHYNRLHPDAPLKLGRQVIRNNLNHLDAVDPEAREAREKRERELIDSLRERNQGKYASGSVFDKLDAERERREAFQQSQMGFFSTEEEQDMFGDVPKADKPLKGDERYTLGHAAERTIAGMMPVIGRNFKPGQPSRIFQPSMSGPDGIMRQRAIKFAVANKRMALAAGTGAGKTGMMLGAFSHLQTQGKAKRGMILCPSIVQGQMGAEALRFMEPGRFNWHCEPGAGRAERIKAYKNPEHHFTVMTHQSFRDDMLHLGAQHAGIQPPEMAERLEAMKPEDRAEWLKGVMEKEGINYDFLSVDEGHNTLNREGKENSAMANVVDALSANTPYYISATADVVKNDLSEAADVMRKMDPKRYGDTSAFMRRYGVNTDVAKDALKREMSRYVLPFKIEPNVRADKREVAVKPSDAQTKALSELDANIGRVRQARMEGGVAVDAIKAISPDSFKGVPEDQHEAIAKELSASIGIMKGSAVRAILDSRPDSAKIDALSKLAGERKGKPGLVFAHSLAAVENIKKRLEADGHRVITLTGADSAKDKAAKIRGFSPGKGGDGQFDIMVASDAGATGANLQHAQWLTQFDSPMTAMTHAQRNGRIHRIGQKHDVELLDLVSDHPSERRARETLKTKYALRELMSSPMEGLDDTGLASYLHQRKVGQQNAELF